MHIKLNYKLKCYKTNNDKGIQSFQGVNKDNSNIKML